MSADMKDDERRARGRGRRGAPTVEPELTEEERMEAELAEWVAAHRSRLPIVAFMAGRFMDEMKGMRFGHAGTIVEGEADTTADKIARMRAAGIEVAERIEEIPVLIRKRLAEAAASGGARRAAGERSH